MALNEARLLASEYAEKILSLQDEMIEKTREKAGFHKSLSVGSVAIMPAITLTERAKKLHEGIESRYEICNDEEKLVATLDDGTFCSCIRSINRDLSAGNIFLRTFRSYCRKIIGLQGRNCLRSKTFRAQPL